MPYHTISDEELKQFIEKTRELGRKLANDPAKAREFMARTGMYSADGRLLRVCDATSGKS